jgi:glyoxylase-like metal-dependent hydrolase (beta-lactamase superfamily II)
MIQVADNIYRLFAGITANQYLIAEPDGISLVDTGLPGSHRLILQSIKQLGYSHQDLKFIFLTHADPDHSGAAAELRRRTPACIVISAIELDGLRNGKMTRKLLQSTFEGFVFNLTLPLFPVNGVEADEVAEDGDVFPVLGGLRAFASPGHTPGHFSYYSDREGVLFAGDAIRCRGKNVTPYLGDSTYDKDTACSSFERLMALKPRLICSGHSCSLVN